MKNPLEASDSTVAQFLWNRRESLCTMCGKLMPEGYCVVACCATYPNSLGEVFLLRFRKAIYNTHDSFKKRVSLIPKHSKVVSGGRVESKRRK